MRDLLRNHLRKESTEPVRQSATHEAETDEEKMLGSARNALEAGDKARAIELCNSILLQSPNNIAAKELLVYVLLTQNDRERAERLLKEMLETDATPYAYKNLAKLMRVQGRVQQARELIETALELYPEDLGIADAAAGIYWHMGQYEEECKLRARILYLSPSPTIAMCEQWLQAKIASSSGIPGKRIFLQEIRHITKLVAGIAQDDPQAAQRYAETLYGIEQMAQEAASLIDQVRSLEPGAPGRPLEVYEWQSVELYCREKGWRYAEAAPLYRRKGAEIIPFIAELRKATVLPNLQWLPLISQDRVSFRRYAERRLRTRREDPASPAYAIGKAGMLIEEPGEPAISVPEGILLGGAGHSHFHNLVEVFGRLAVAERFPEYAQLPLIIDSRSAQDHAELFGLLGVAPERIIPVPLASPIRVDRLIAPSPPNRGGSIVHPMLAQWYRAKFPARHPRSSAKRLFLVQGDGLQCRIVNGRELFEALESLGFAIVSLETLSLAEQIGLFDGTEIVVGPAGNAMTNLLFMPPGATAVVLYNQSLLASRGDLYYDALAEACGLQHVAIGCGSELNAENPLVDADIRAPIEEVVAGVESVLSGRG